MFNVAALLTGYVTPELATVLLAMLPVGELRLALPTALIFYKLPLAQAVFLAVLGNMLPVYFLLFFLERVSGWLRVRSLRAAKVLDWLFDRTRKKLDGRVKKYGYWALALFVAVPLPVTGAWTGSVAAFVFGLPKKQSFIAILIGVIVSAAIVTALTLGTSFVARGILS